MKKLFTLLFCTAALSLNALAQNEPTQLIVHYKFKHVRDKQKPESPYTENMMLLVGPQTTVYTSYDAIGANKAVLDAIKKQLIEQGAMNDPSKIKSITVPPRPREITKDVIYNQPGKKQITQMHKLVNNYLVNEPYPVIKWQILKDTTTLGGLHCQKATAAFKGRNYTAWFTPDLPVSSGPWKLSGLPGLILSAQDDKDEVAFTFDGIEKPESLQPQTVSQVGTTTMRTSGNQLDITTVSFPADAITISTEEYNKLNEFFQKDPSAFFQTMAASRGAVAPGNNVQTRAITTAPAGPRPAVKIINNPIELTK